MNFIKKFNYRSCIMTEILELLHLYKCKEIFMFHVDVIYF